MANDSGNPNKSVAAEFNRLAAEIKRSNDEMIAFQEDNYLRRKEEEQEKLIENRRNFRITRESIIKNIGRAIVVMTRKIVNAILFTSDLLIRLITVGIVIVLAKFYQIIATTIASIRVGFGSIYFLFNYLPKAIPEMVANIARLKAAFMNSEIILKGMGYLTTISNLLSRVINPLLNFFRPFMATMVEAIKGLNIFRKAVATIVSISLYAIAVYDKLRPVIKAVGVIFGILKKVVKVVMVIGRVVGYAFRVIVEVGEFAGMIFKFFGKVFSFLKPVLPFLRLVGTLAKVVPFLGQIILVIEGIVGFIRGFTGTEGTFLEKLSAGLVGIFAQILSGLTFGLLSFEDVMGYFGYALDKTGGLLSLAFDGIVVLIKAAGKWFGGLFGGIADMIDDDIMPIINSVIDGIGSFFSMLKDFFIDTVPKIFIGFKDGFIDSLLFILSVVGKIDPTGYVQDAMDYLESFKSTASTNISQGSPDRSLVNAAAVNRNMNTIVDPTGKVIYVNNSPSINNQTYVKGEVNPRREGTSFIPMNDDYRASYGRGVGY